MTTLAGRWRAPSQRAIHSLDLIGIEELMSTSETTTEDDVKKRKEPTSPGEILREEFLAPLVMTQKQLADHLRCDVKVINRIVNGRTSVSAEMAIRQPKGARLAP